MPTINDIVSWGALATAIISIWTFYTKVTQPFKDLTSRVDELERQQKATWVKLDNDHSQLEMQEDMNALLLKAIKTMMTHEIDGSHIEQLKECVKEIDMHLYKKGGSL